VSVTQERHGKRPSPRRPYVKPRSPEQGLNIIIP
jgi:hypothetical protein